MSVHSNLVCGTWRWLKKAKEHIGPVLCGMMDLSGHSPSLCSPRQSRLRPSAFKPVTPKNFSSMQNLYPAKDALDTVVPAASNGMRPSYITTATSKSLSSASSSSSSPSRHHGGKAPQHQHQHQQQLAAAAASRHRSQEEEEENASDSGHHSLSSLLPPYRPPPFRPHLGHISVSMGHIDHIGSLERSSAAGSRGALSSAATEASLPPGSGSSGATATLGRLRGYGSEAPPPYELSMSMEDVVRDLEERLIEKDQELRQMRRNLDESEDAIAQVRLSSNPGS